MSEEIDYPFTWEASQNSQGYFQIRFKAKSEKMDISADMLTAELTKIKNSIENAGFKMQPEKEMKK